MSGSKESNGQGIPTYIEAPGRRIGTVDENLQSGWSDEVSCRLINHIAINKK